MTIPAWLNIAPAPNEPAYITLGRQYRDSAQLMILHVDSWSHYNPPTPLAWARIRYKSSDKPPASRGVYAFVLVAEEVAPSLFPPHAFILYVGETGDNGKQTLRDRLRNYRNKKSQWERARITNLLLQWEDELFFYYATVPTGISTKACETALLDALLPPANKKDFSAFVHQAREWAFPY